MIRFDNWTIQADGEILARQFDNLTRTLTVTGDIPTGWEWAMLVQVGAAMDILMLEPVENGVGVVLTAEQLSLSGYYNMQLRATQGDKVRHTNTINVYIPASLSGDAKWPTVPSEFTQAEQRTRLAAQEAESYATHPPIRGENGNWWLWNGEKYADSGETYTGNELYANALKGTARGATVRLDDVSPLEHTLSVQLRSKNLLQLEDREIDLSDGTATIKNGAIEVSHTTAGTHGWVHDHIPVVTDLYLPKGDYFLKAFSSIDVLEGQKTYYSLRIIDILQKPITFDEKYVLTWTDTHEGALPNGPMMGIGDTGDGFAFTVTEACTVSIELYIPQVTQIPMLEEFTPQLELGVGQTDYTPYRSDFSNVVVSVLDDTDTEVATYPSDAEGKVVGVKSIYPIMKLRTDTFGASIECVYNRDIDIAVQEALTQTAPENSEEISGLYANTVKGTSYESLGNSVYRINDISPLPHDMLLQVYDRTGAQDYAWLYKRFLNAESLDVKVRVVNVPQAFTIETIDDPRPVHLTATIVTPGDEGYGTYHSSLRFGCIVYYADGTLEHFYTDKQIEENMTLQISVRPDISPNKQVYCIICRTPRFYASDEYDPSYDAKVKNLECWIGYTRHDVDRDYYSPVWNTVKTPGGSPVIFSLHGGDVRLEEVIYNRDTDKVIQELSNALEQAEAQLQQTETQIQQVQTVANAAADASVGSYELVETIKTTEELTQIVRTTYPDGTPYNFKAMLIKFDVPIGAGQGLIVTNYQPSNGKGNLATFSKYSINGSSQQWAWSRFYKDFDRYCSEWCTGSSIYSQTVYKMAGLDEKFGDTPVGKIIISANTSGVPFPIGTTIKIYGVRA